MGRVIVILKSTGGTLLASLRPLLVCVCSNPVKYSDPNLRASASLALAKFMLVRYVIDSLDPDHFDAASVFLAENSVVNYFLVVYCEYPIHDIVFSCVLSA